MQNPDVTQNRQTKIPGAIMLGTEIKYLKSYGRKESFNEARVAVNFESQQTVTIILCHFHIKKIKSFY
jgi:hypothetical protein